MEVPLIDEANEKKSPYISLLNVDFDFVQRRAGLGWNVPNDELMFTANRGCNNIHILVAKLPRKEARKYVLEGWDEGADLGGVELAVWAGRVNWRYGEAAEPEEALDELAGEAEL